MTQKYGKPDFIGIGAMRSGSSWLHYNLKRHPQIFMPNVKELHYFDKIEKGRYNLQLSFGNLNYLMRYHLKYRTVNFRDLLFYANYFLVPRSDSWYVRNFTFAVGRPVMGEITPAYSILDEAMICDIHAKWPDLKIILLMRNPVERAWSHIVKSLARDRKVKIGDIDPAKIIEKAGEVNVLIKGEYADILDRWGKYYGPSSMFVGFYEQISDEPLVLLQEICMFLGVEFSPEYFREDNVEKVVNSTRAHGSAVPDYVKARLYRHYYETICRIETRYGSYAGDWRREATEFI